MEKHQNILIPNPGSLNFPADMFWESDGIRKPVVIFLHGFKGFKDWGHFPLMAEYFASNGFVFVKFNISHGGTSLDEPLEFTNLEAFSQNTYSHEIHDLGVMIDWVEKQSIVPSDEINKSAIYLLGHSRGGAISIIKASEDERVKKIATLGSVASIGNRYSEKQMQDWKEKGVKYFPNARTGQLMPLLYNHVLDFELNKERLNVKNALLKLKIPLLVVHGDADETVKVEEAFEIQRNCPRCELEIIEGGNHSFGGSHPYNSRTLPHHSLLAVERIIQFFKENG